MNGQVNRLDKKQAMNEFWITSTCITRIRRITQMTIILRATLIDKKYVKLGFPRSF
jgi:hypothetical protein